MDAWGWSALGPWLSERATLPVGPLFCVIDGPTRGHAWSASAARLRAAPARARGGRPPAVRAPPAPPRARRRAVARGHPAAADPAPARALAPLHDRVGSGRGAVSALPPARFPDPPSEPDVPIPEHPALHRTRCPIVALIRQRWLPVEWWLGLFRSPPTAMGCCGRDSDIGSLVPRRARRASCLLGWSSGAPSTFA